MNKIFNPAPKQYVLSGISSIAQDWTAAGVEERALNSGTDGCVLSGVSNIVLDWTAGGISGIVINSFAAATYFCFRMHAERRKDISDDNADKTPKLQFKIQAGFQALATGASLIHSGVTSEAGVLFLSLMSNALLAVPKEKLDVFPDRVAERVAGTWIVKTIDPPQKLRDVGYGFIKVVSDPYFYWAWAYGVAATNVNVVRSYAQSVINLTPHFSSAVAFTALADLTFLAAFALTVFRAAPGYQEMISSRFGNGNLRLKDFFRKAANFQFARPVRRFCLSTMRSFSAQLRDKEFPLLIMTTGCIAAAFAVMPESSLKVYLANVAVVALYGCACLSVLTSEKYGGIAEYLGIARPKKAVTATASSSERPSL